MKNEEIAGFCSLILKKMWATPVFKCY